MTKKQEIESVVGERSPHPMTIRVDKDIKLWLDEHTYANRSDLVNRMLRAAIYYLYLDDQPMLICKGCGSKYSALLIQCPQCKKASSKRWWGA